MIATNTPTRTDCEAFLDSLRASELLDGRQLDRALRAMPPHPRSARDAADYFLQSELLTRFQIERLLSGRTDGFHIGPYLVLDYLGKSATGQVYKARHRTMNRLVAIKILALEQTATDAVRQSIRAEARSAARLAHTNIVTLLDANQAGERMYFVKEYLDGGSLETLVRAQGPLPIRRACEFIRQAALGLQHAHEKGVAHGRLSPTAILVGRVGGKGSDDKPLVKVSGFGLGRLGADDAEPDFEYRAPEQFDNPDRADPAADLYSLGCIFHYLLVGRPPFPASGADEAAAHHRHSPPPALEPLRPDLPAPLASLVRNLLDKNPQARPAWAGDIACCLQCYADGDDSGGAIDFGSLPGAASSPASKISKSLPAVLADLPHEPILFDDDLTPAPTMVFDAIVPVASVAETPTLRTRRDPTPIALPKRKTTPVAGPRARRKPTHGRTQAVSPLALGALVAGVCAGVLFAIVCILKIYETVK